MSNSNIIDLCSDDELEESNMKNSEREIVPGSYSAPSVCPTPICQQFWKAGNYEIVQGQGYKAPNQNGRNHMRIHPMFLHSNATSHRWAFGAIAELLDNVVDEIKNGATFVTIDKISTPRDGNPALLIQDDGGGMDPDAIRRCMSFGFSDKKSELEIGQYGNGFKTSSMRLGADVIVFSSHLNSRSLTQSVGLLSYTFLRRMGYDKIVVPMVDYEFNSTAGPFGPILPHGKDHFSSNLTMLLQWSPYSTEEELLQQFDDIGHHGTKIVIYNLWLNDDGDMELDFDTDPEDICITGGKTCDRVKPIFDKHVANLYKYSLRAYASILYKELQHDFRIILRGRVVEHINIAKSLKYLEFIRYRPHNGGNMEVEFLTAIGYLKEAPHVNIHGFNIYHRNRLILPFWPALKNMKNTGRGIAGVLEANFIQPTHNKQDFERTPLFEKLEDRLKKMTQEYWDKHCGLIGYHKAKKTHPIALHSRNESSKESCRAVGSLEYPEVTTSDPKVSSQEGLIIKRKDVDLQVELQPAKRHLGSCGIDAQPITEQSEISTENMQLVSQKITLMRENKRLRSQLLEFKNREEELNLKVQQLKSEKKNVLFEYAQMLVESNCYTIDEWESVWEEHFT